MITQLHEQAEESKVCQVQQTKKQSSMHLKQHYSSQNDEESTQNYMHVLEESKQMVHV